jgi:hypothetical protein
MMQQPFPALKHLDLGLHPGDEPVLVVPASFLGGSAPYLEVLNLDRILFPGLPNLLLSAARLIYLRLWRIPHSGYISPKAMVGCLSVLTRLQYLDITFESPQSRPDQKSRHPPPRTRAFLPVLAELWFKGVSEYLEDLVAQIDTPLLDKLKITFFNQLIFETPQLTQFIGRTPKLKAHNVDTHAVFSYQHVLVRRCQEPVGKVELGISCRQSDWQLSSLAQVCSSSFPQAHIPTVERLDIHDDRSWPPDWQEDIESSQWLDIFHLFPGVKDLYISREFVPRIAPALQELVGERATEVLPALRTIYLETGAVQKAIGPFVAARQLTGHPIAISFWDRSNVIDD